MVEALKDKGFNGYAIVVPTASELLLIFKLAAPVFIMMMSKVYMLHLLLRSLGAHVPYPKYNW